MASRYRWRQQLLGSLQGQLQLATYLVVFLGFTGASSVGLLIGQRNLLANDQQLARQSIALCDKAIRGLQIAQDLEELRRKTWRWRCESGTGCTGNADDADKPVAYQTSRIDDAAISALLTACGFDSNGNRIAQSVAQLMQQEQATDFPAGPTALPWVTHSSTTPPAGSEGITI